MPHPAPKPMTTMTLSRVDVENIVLNWMEENGFVVDVSKLEHIIIVNQREANIYGGIKFELQLPVKTKTKPDMPKTK